MKFFDLNSLEDTNLNALPTTVELPSRGRDEKPSPPPVLANFLTTGQLTERSLTREPWPSEGTPQRQRRQRCLRTGWSPCRSNSPHQAQPHLHSRPRSSQALQPHCRTWLHRLPRRHPRSLCVTTCSGASTSLATVSSKSSKPWVLSLVSRWPKPYKFPHPTFSPQLGLKMPTTN